MARGTVWIVASIMILSLIPLPAVAEVTGDWETYRSVDDYGYPEDAETYTPAPGYEYTSEGFQTIPADAENTPVFFTVQTKEPRPVKEGLYLSVRIDEFPYQGLDQREDEWISFHIWDTQNMSPGVVSHGSGWQCLLRGTGGGSVAGLQSYVTTATAGDQTGSFAFKDGSPDVTPLVDDEGREIYNLTVEFTDGEYRICVNGSEAAGAADITETLNRLNPNGEFYVGVTLHSTAQGERAGLTITAFGASEDEATVPAGSDSKDPEENINKPPVDLMDASTIPANQPALLWDANKTSFVGDPHPQNMQMTAQGDGSYHCSVGGDSPLLMWSIRRDLSYRAEDFPLFAMLLRNYWGPGGPLCYCAGDVKGPTGDAAIGWNLYGEHNQIYGKNEEYLLVAVDLTGRWSGRIHALRPGFPIEDPLDPEMCHFDIMWMGMFRSPEEAQAYTDQFVEAQGVALETEAPTAAPTASPAASPTEAPTASPTEAPTDAPTDAPTEAGDEAPRQGGCASAAGAGAVLLAAAVAAVALKGRRL